MSDTPRTNAFYRDLWTSPSGSENFREFAMRLERELARAVAQNLDHEAYIAGIEKDLAAVRARSSRQRKELHRLNKAYSALWRGFTYGLARRGLSETRLAMIEAFGHDAVRKAEQDYVTREQVKAMQEKAK